MCYALLMMANKPEMARLCRVTHLIYMILISHIHVINYTETMKCGLHSSAGVRTMLRLCVAHLDPVKCVAMKPA